MESIEGLNDDIQSALMANAKSKVIDQILSAAKEGRTEIKVRSKALTPSFIRQLEDELVFANTNDDGSYTLYWEF